MISLKGIFCKAPVRRADKQPKATDSPAASLSQVDTYISQHSGQASRPMTQRELNEQASLAYQEAENQMRYVFFQLAARKGESMPMGSPQKGGLYEAQALWDESSEAQAKAQSKPYQRSRLHTCIYLEAKKESVLARTKELAQELEKITPKPDPDVATRPPMPMTYVTQNDYYF